MGHDRDAQLRQPVEQRVEPLVIEPAEAKRMTDRHPACQPERLRALADHLGNVCALLAALVQVDVDTAAVSRGDREDGVDLTLGVAVDRGRTNAADRLGSIAHCGFKQIERARLDHYATLGKRDDLQVDQVAVRLASGQLTVQMRQPDLGRDVHVRAHVGGATCDHVPQQPRALLLRRKF